MENIPELSANPPEIKVMAYCARCKSEIYGYPYKTTSGETLCGDCFSYSVSREAIADYIKTEMDYLYDFLMDSDDENTLAVLENFRSWARTEFEEWLLKNK